MVETRGCPPGSRVTHGTIVIESLQYMIRRRYTFKVGLVTTVASGRRSGKRSTVAFGAHHGGMLSGQGKSGGSMIERRWLPGCGRVTGGTIVIELCQPVVGFRREIEVPLVTGIAGGGRPGILSSVTGGTSNLYMCTGQRKCRCGVIIIGRLPTVNGMTHGTIVRDTAGLVIRRGRRRVCGAMAGITVGRRTRIARSMTRLAGNTQVPTDERERGRVAISGVPPTGRRRLMT